MMNITITSPDMDSVFNFTSLMDAFFDPSRQLWGNMSEFVGLLILIFTFGIAYIRSGVMSVPAYVTLVLFTTLVYIAVISTTSFIAGVVMFIVIMTTAALIYTIFKSW